MNAAEVQNLRGELGMLCSSVSRTSLLDPEGRRWHHTPFRSNLGRWADGQSRVQLLPRRR